MRPQPDFDICCTVFSPLQNGKKKVKKKRYAWGEKGLTILVKKTAFLGKNYCVIFLLKIELLTNYE
jgi:hypothetical protein